MQCLHVFNDIFGGEMTACHICTALHCFVLDNHLYLIVCWLFCNTLKKHGLTCTILCVRWGSRCHTIHCMLNREQGETTRNITHQYTACWTGSREKQLEISHIMEFSVSIQSGHWRPTTQNNQEPWEQKKKWLSFDECERVWKSKKEKQRKKEL